MLSKFHQASASAYGTICHKVGNGPMSPVARRAFKLWAAGVTSGNPRRTQDCIDEAKAVLDAEVLDLVAVELFYKNCGSQAHLAALAIHLWREDEDPDDGMDVMDAVVKARNYLGLWARLTC